jgi:hypothetical protein
MRVRRKAGLATLRQSELGKRCVVLALDRCIERMTRKVSLDEHLTRPVSAPGAPRHLGQLRKQLLRRAKVGAV